MNAASPTTTPQSSPVCLSDMDMAASCVDQLFPHLRQTPNAILLEEALLVCFKAHLSFVEKYTPPNDNDTQDDQDLDTQDPHVFHAFYQTPHQANVFWSGLIKECIIRGADPNIAHHARLRAQMCRTPLLYAITRLPNLVPFLLTHGADPNQILIGDTKEERFDPKTKTRTTTLSQSVPLMQACFRDTSANLEVVRALLSNNADINQTDQKGASCLHVAVEDGNLDLIDLLLEHNIDVSLQATFVQWGAHLLPRTALEDAKARYQLRRTPEREEVYRHLKARLDKKAIQSAGVLQNLSENPTIFARKF